MEKNLVGNYAGNLLDRTLAVIGNAIEYEIIDIHVLGCHHAEKSCETYKHCANCKQIKAICTNCL